MNKIIIKAKFIGADGSLGYKNGEQYSLVFTQRKFNSKISIYKINLNGGYCIYDSMETFLHNWDNISLSK